MFPYKNELLLIAKVFSYIAFIPLACIDLYVIASNIRYPYWAIIGYTDSFNKSSILFFLYDKSSYYAALYLLLEVFCIALPFLLSIMYLRKQIFLSLLLALPPYFIQFLFYDYEDIWWKWINDNIYNFGFHLM